MDADVGERSDRIITLTYGKHWRIDNVPADEVTGVWNLRRATETYPATTKQVLMLELEDLRAVVNSWRQAARIAKRRVRVLRQQLQ